MSELTPEREAYIRHKIQQHEMLNQSSNESLLAEIDRLRAALADRDRQLAELREAWQPIETAPTDGRVFLVSKVGVPGVGLIKDGRFRLWPSLISWNPTHWMPFPAGPWPIAAALLPDPNPAKEGTPW